MLKDIPETPQSAQMIQVAAGKTEEVCCRKHRAPIEPDCTGWAGGGEKREPAATRLTRQTARTCGVTVQLTHWA